VVALLGLIACHQPVPAGPPPTPPPATSASAATTAATAAPLLRWRVAQRHPHDPEAFTQGLLWHQGRLYESTGGYGTSSVRRVELASGRVEERVALPDSLFGEGLALVGSQLLQLTWREGRALRWDAVSLAQIGEHGYAGEGWGLAFDGSRLVQSDGSATLTWRDPTTFAAVGSVTVTDGGGPVPLINELEWIEGALWANVWQSDQLLRIDPVSGRVTGRLDLTTLRDDAVAVAGGRPIDVLNGIAWRPETRTLLFTGKLWSLLFELELPDARAADRSAATPLPARVASR
jgi:glutaminyl-peptide cyclotransferase